MLIHRVIFEEINDIIFMSEREKATQIEFQQQFIIPMFGKSPTSSLESMEHARDTLIENIQKQHEQIATTRTKIQQIKGLVQKR